MILSGSAIGGFELQMQLGHVCNWWANFNFSAPVSFSKVLGPETQHVVSYPPVRKQSFVLLLSITGATRQSKAADNTLDSPTIKSGFDFLN